MKRIKKNKRSNYTKQPYKKQKHEKPTVSDKPNEGKKKQSEENVTPCQTLILRACFLRPLT